MNIAIGICCLVGATTALPTFPSEWSSQLDSTIMVFQGGTHNDTAMTACCDLQAAQCKVQTEGLTGTMYADKANNRTAYIVGDQVVFNFFHPINKQVSATQNGSGWTCQSYCPIDDGAYPDPLAFDTSAKDMGKAVVDGNTYERYMWYDNLFKKWVHMDEQDWYIDQSGSKPIPYFNVEKITPFGSAEIALSTGKYKSFTEGAPKASIFDIDLTGCPVGDNCNPDESHPTLQKQKQKRSLLAPRRTYRGRRERSLKAVGTTASAGATWPVDWSAMETQSLVINQGGVPSTDNKAICCVVSSMSQCQVQTEYIGGQKYYDYSHNRTRFEHSDGQIFVDDYTTKKSLQVQHNGTHDVCVAYCPIDPDDTLDSGKLAFMDANATDLGKATFKGQTAEHYQWKEKILKIITMQISDLYVSITGATATPLGRVDHLTPFGKPLGDMNVDWQNFKPGPQPAEKFDIQGAATCPQDPNCGQDSRQLHRLATRQLSTYAQYVQYVGSESRA